MSKNTVNLVATLVVSVLAVGGFLYYTNVYHPVTTSRGLSDTNIPSKIPNGWHSYSADTWSISYPPTFTIRKIPGLNAISIKDSGGANFLGINYGPLDAKPEADALKKILSLNPGGDLLDARLTLFNTTIPMQDKGFSVVAASKISISNLPAAQVIYTEKETAPDSLGYTNQVTFAKGDYLVDITMVRPVLMPDQKVLDEYQQILGSFRFN